MPAGWDRADAVCARIQRGGFGLCRGVESQQPRRLDLGGKLGVPFQSYGEDMASNISHHMIALATLQCPEPV